MKRTLIQNAVIVNEGRKVLGSVVIENEKIAEIWVGEENATAPCDEIIDATGCYLLPGAIDEHVHFRDPGLTHKADITTESRAAAAGGVTSIMDMPNTNPQTTTLEALEEKFILLGEKIESEDEKKAYFIYINFRNKLIKKMKKDNRYGKLIWLRIKGM